MKHLFTLVLALVFATGAMATDNARAEKSAKAYGSEVNQRLALDKTQADKLHKLMVEYFTEEEVILASTQSKAEKEKAIVTLKQNKEQLMFKFLSEEQIAKWRLLKKEKEQKR